MSILDQIKAHSRPGETRTIEVPEWGTDGQPLVIHFTMVTLGDIEVARSRVKDNTMRQNCEIVVLKAQNADGSKMFKSVDAVELMEVADPVVLLRVANAMSGAKSAEEIEKN